MHGSKNELEIRKAVEAAKLHQPLNSVVPQAQQSLQNSENLPQQGEYDPNTKSGKSEFLDDLLTGNGDKWERAGPGAQILPKSDSLKNQGNLADAFQGKVPSAVEVKEVGFHSSDKYHSSLKDRDDFIKKYGDKFAHFEKDDAEDLETKKHRRQLEREALRHEWRVENSMLSKKDQEEARIKRRAEKQMGKMWGDDSEDSDGDEDDSPVHELHRVEEGKLTASVVVHRDFIKNIIRFTEFSSGPSL